ncbi:MAG: RnfABCDGE type electron transport complex subunit D [Elusimicrobiota bacterium]
MKLRNTGIKILMISVLVISAITGIIEYSITFTLPQILLSVVSALVFDFIGTSIRKKESLYFSTSAVISGLIIGLVLEPEIEWYIPIAAAAFAMGTKHLIRLKQGHIFNPANIGLLFSVIAFGSNLLWWGSVNTWLVIILGLFIAYKFKRIHLILSFFITQFLILVIYYYSKGLPIKTALTISNFFFVFVMVVEPKTSPIRKKGRIIYGILTSVIACVIIITRIFLNPWVVSLAIANIFVPFINKLNKKDRTKTGGTSMKKTELRFLDKKDMGGGINNFIFKVKNNFTYSAGQYAFFDFKYNDKEYSKHFTISNSPTRKNIEMTTIMSGSDYKNALNSLESGHKVYLRGPYGNFILQSKKSDKICFLSGGIGITTARSILQYCADKGIDLDATLFYSNRNFERMTFRQELEEIENKLKNFKVVHTLTDLTEEQKQQWDGETGYITADMIKKYRPDYNECHFYVTGPPAFNNAMKSILQEKLNIQKELIKLENFIGY